jgi:hypothetical protein
METEHFCNLVLKAQVVAVAPAAAVAVAVAVVHVLQIQCCSCTKLISSIQFVNTRFVCVYF